MLTEAGRPGVWTVEDRLLARALREYEDGLCPGCGLPKHRVYTGDGIPGDPSGYPERRKIRCEGCAAEVENDGTHGKPTKPEKGDKDYTVWVERGSG